MKNTILAIIVGGLLITSSLYITAEKEVNDLNQDEEIEEELSNEKVSEEFVNCLQEKGVVIYGSSTCSACAKLEEEYGGYSVMEKIYLDCSGLGSEEDFMECREKMQTGYVPEVQIKGELFDGWGSPENLSKETGCPL